MGVAQNWSNLGSSFFVGFTMLGRQFSIFVKKLGEKVDFVEVVAFLRNFRSLFKMKNEILYQIREMENIFTNDHFTKLTN